MREYQALKHKPDSGDAEFSCKWYYLQLSLQCYSYKLIFWAIHNATSPERANLDTYTSITKLSAGYKQSFLSYLYQVDLTRGHHASQRSSLYPPKPFVYPIPVGMTVLESFPACGRKSDSVDASLGHGRHPGLLAKLF